ncbi:MAG: isoprenyl transferase [Candidatus Omnitrophica bacterium]|nr:isoprenyl transferase [Candidatus Omnitrophota bacterium]
MLAKNNIPKHIAFIMDGNGRWAKERGLARTAGHRQGIKRVKEIIRGAGELGVEVVTFFTFSTENWERPKKEIDTLMRYLDKFLDGQIKELERNNMRFQVIGQDDPLPGFIQNKIKKAENRTKDNTGLVVVLALNYGSRQEIVDAAKGFATSVLKDNALLEQVTCEIFSRYFYTADLPDPDLLIRTSGEMRISNFMLWQLSYAELYFSNKYWPDFTIDELKKAIGDFKKRERRFGGIDVSKEDN